MDWIQFKSHRFLVSFIFFSPYPEQISHFLIRSQTDGGIFMEHSFSAVGAAVRQ